MIEFHSPALSLSLTGYMEMAELWEQCSSCAGFAVSLGERFFHMESGRLTQKYFLCFRLKQQAMSSPVSSHLTRYYFGFHVRCVDISLVLTITLITSIFYSY